MKSHTRGFTIVELLVVIVVIAILASISIVAYNGIQERAQNSKTASAVSAYLKAFEVLRLDGKLPVAGVNGVEFYNCLGEDYTNNRCYDGSASYQENTTVNGLLKSTIGNTLPMPNLVSPGLVGVVFVAASTQAPNSFWTIDGTPTNWLAYAVNGSGTSCPVGQVATFTGTTFTSAKPPNNQTVGGVTPVCYIALKP